jgi:hypothetical protein
VGTIKIRFGERAGQKIRELDPHIRDLADLCHGVFGEHLGLQVRLETVGNAFLPRNGNVRIGDDDKLDFLKGKTDIAR